MCILQTTLGYRPRLVLNMHFLAIKALNSTILVSFIVLTFLSWYRELLVLTTSRHVLACLLVTELLITSSGLISTIMSLLFRDSVLRLRQLLNQCTSSTSLIKQQSRDNHKTAERKPLLFFFLFKCNKGDKIALKSINIYMADYDNNNRTFTDALYGTRANQDVGLPTALTNAFGTPPPLSAADEVFGTYERGGFFNLSAYNNSFSLVSASSVHTFADDPVVGILFNVVDSASGQHVMQHHLEDPITGGGNAGVEKHAAATIRFAGNYFHPDNHSKHRRIALVTKNGNTITYTIDKHETGHHRHTFTATGSAGSGFDNSINTLGLNGTAGAVGPNTRRKVALGYI